MEKIRRKSAPYLHASGSIREMEYNFIWNLMTESMPQQTRRALFFIANIHLTDLQAGRDLRYCRSTNKGEQNYGIF